MTAARSRKPQVQADLPLTVPEGVHLRMPERVYFGAGAIGSTDLKTLYWDAPSWWAASEHNPYRRRPANPTRTVGKDMGSGLHALVLEGESAYTSRFAIEPDVASNRWVHSRDQLRKLFRECSIPWPAGQFNPQALHAMVRRHGLSHRVFEVARLDYEAARKSGRQHLTEDEDRRLRATAHLINTHDQLGPAFRGGLSEVAVFWRRKDDPATLLRAKFDKLRLKRIYDLKSIGNWRGRDIDSAIRQAIEDNDYDIQRRLYPEAWEAMAEFVRAGQVHAWNPDGETAAVLQDERGLLNQIVDAGEPEWIWVFVQIPVDDIGRERAAVIAPRHHRPTGRIWDEAGEKVETALSNYRRFRDDFTLDRPWSLVTAVTELVDGDIRSRVKREMA